MIIVVCYLLVVYYGPGIMEKRKPFQLKPLLVIYNVAITGLNLWIALEVGVIVCTVHCLLKFGIANGCRSN